VCGQHTWETAKCGNGLVAVKTVDVLDEGWFGLEQLLDGFITREVDELSMSTFFKEWETFNERRRTNAPELGTPAMSSPQVEGKKE
jgi:hypothetical protein